MKIPQIFWKCVPIKIPGEKIPRILSSKLLQIFLSEFLEKLASLKFSYFLLGNFSQLRFFLRGLSLDKSVLSESIITLPVYWIPKNNICITKNEDHMKSLHSFCKNFDKKSPPYRWFKNVQLKYFVWASFWGCLAFCRT